MPQASQPLPYTASPYRLALADLLLWARITFVWPPWAGVPSIIFPIFPFRSGALDELYPSISNIHSLTIQLALTILQALFLLTLPISATLGIGFPFLPPVLGAYVPIWLSWAVGFVFLNRILSILLLDGLSREFKSQVPLPMSDISAHKDEKWVFVNGVAAGSHWMQSNLDRLSLTFSREIHGIHNQTRGILFDLIECILERTFSYPTPSTRIVYQRLLDIVSDEQYNKIVLILHSQGAIEGGLALDWLFATVPASQLARMEVYTFGSAANHFNNPVATAMDQLGRRIDLPLDRNDNTTSRNGYGDDSDSFQQGRVLHHIEHYANSGDYVAKFGILNFRPLPASIHRRTRGAFWRTGFLSNAARTATSTVTMTETDLAPASQIIANRYVGRLFIRDGTGHQLNGNYLDDFFPMDRKLSTVLDGPDDCYMNGTIDLKLLQESDVVVVAQDQKLDGRRGRVERITVAGSPEDGDEVDDAQDYAPLTASDIKVEREELKVRDVSRLWMYRNGMSPKDSS